MEFATTFNGKAKIIKLSLPYIAVYSDASLFGFSATHDHDWLAGAFKFNDEKMLHGWLGHHLETAKDVGCRKSNINVLELWPILAGVRRWGQGTYGVTIP